MSYHLTGKVQQFLLGHLQPLFGPFNTDDVAAALLLRHADLHARLLLDALDCTRTHTCHTTATIILYLQRFSLQSRTNSYLTREHVLTVGALLADDVAVIFRVYLNLHKSHA